MDGNGSGDDAAKSQGEFGAIGSGLHVGSGVHLGQDHEDVGLSAESNGSVTDVFAVPTRPAKM